MRDTILTVFIVATLIFGTLTYFFPNGTTVSFLVISTILSCLAIYDAFMKERKFNNILLKMT